MKNEIIEESKERSERNEESIEESIEQLNDHITDHITEHITDHFNDIHTDLLRKIAQCCKQTIIDPKFNLMNLLFVFDQKDVAYDVVLISLMKVFLEIIPLYSIKKTEKVVKSGQQKSKLTKFEEDLLMIYQKYILMVLNRQKEINFKCASNLLKNLSHFNFTEKLVYFVLKGTTLKEESCFDVLYFIFKSDDLDLQFKVLSSMSDLNFDEKILSFLFEIDIYSFEAVKDSFFTGFIYEKEKIKKEKKESLKIDKNLSKSDKKEERIRKKLENQRLEEEGIINEEKKKQMEFKVCNTILKVYFLIMKSKRKEYYENVFIGLRKFKLIMRNDLLEGTKELILECFENASQKDKFYGILAILSLYENKSIDLEKIKEKFYNLIEPFALDISENDQKLITKTLKHLFLLNRQSLDCVIRFLRRLMVLCSLNYYCSIGSVVQEIVEFYEVGGVGLECSVFNKMYYL